MKILVLSFTAAILLTACDSNKKNKSDLQEKETSEQTDSTGDKKTAEIPADAPITGKWKPVEMNLKGMSEEEKKEMGKDILLEFTATGNYSGVNKGNRQEGTYTYEAANKKLTIKSNANSMEVETFTIGWEGDLLLMTNDEGTVKLRREM